MSENCLIEITRQASPLMIEMVDAFKKGYGSSSQETFLLTLELDEYGRDEALYKMLRKGFNPEGKRGAILISSPSTLYTKSVLTEHVHLLNSMGMTFPGIPYVEAIPGLMNMRNVVHQLHISPKEALLRRCRDLGRRLSHYQPKPFEKLLVIHANSKPEQSNTMALFRRVEQYLKGIEVSVEIIREEIQDCRGCSYKACGYFNDTSGCFYGSVFNEAFLEKVTEYDAILWLAPNYNDALSAKIMAIINRFSALYKFSPFYDKSLYALIVSGNSGSDSVARQLIGALCLNKGFSLPAKFYAHKIANDPGEIQKHPDFDLVAREFADRLNRCAKQAGSIHAINL